MNVKRPRAALQRQPGASTGGNPAVEPMEPPDRPISDEEAFEALAPAACRRLTDLLDPKTEKEVELVGWLADLISLQQLLTLCELIELRPREHVFQLADIGGGTALAAWMDYSQQFRLITRRVMVTRYATSMYVSIGSATE
jgi:hypothetical protein